MGWYVEFGWVDDFRVVIEVSWVELAAGLLGSSGWVKLSTFTLELASVFFFFIFRDDIQKSQEANGETNLNTNYTQRAKALEKNSNHGTNKRRDSHLRQDGNDIPTTPIQMELYG